MKKQEMIKRYQNGETMAEIGRKAGVSRQYIDQVLKDHNVIRSRSGVCLACNRAYITTNAHQKYCTRKCGIRFARTGKPFPVEEDILTDIIERMSANIKTEPNGCWVWVGNRSGNGYGRIGYRGLIRYTHRLMWELVYDNIPTGLYVLHKCDNPPCVNPKHLWIGTQGDNIRDRTRKGRTVNKRKLTYQQAQEIRDKRLNGDKLRVLSTAYDVSGETIRRIIKGRTYKK